MTSSGDRISIIAGSGQLPLHIARGLLRAGSKPYVAALIGAADPALDDLDCETAWYAPYSLHLLLDGLKQAGAKKVVLAGRVGHDEIYRTGEFDQPLKDLLENLKDRRPATILGGLVDLLTSRDLHVLPLTDVAPDLVPEAGCIAGPVVDPRYLPDIHLGWRIARAVADLDIGQTAVVSSGAVVSVEAMEGTDRAIERAGMIAGGGLTVVKLAASNHDFRYDIPMVGPDTIQRLGGSGGGVITIEAGRCLLLDPDRVSALCDEQGVTLISARETADGQVQWP